MTRPRLASLSLALLPVGALSGCLTLPWGWWASSTRYGAPGEIPRLDTSLEDTGWEDPDCELPEGVLPVTAADAMILGDDREGFGEFATRVGDLNGDGYDDLGVWLEPDESRIWFGPLEGRQGDDSPDLVADGVALLAGDLDADGFDDLIAVASGDGADGAYLDYGPLAPGEAHGPGDADAWIYTSTDGSSPTWTGAFGEADEAFHGVMLGAHNDATSGYRAGAAYGFVEAPLGDTPLDHAAFTLLGEEAGDFAGVSLTGVGDTDGDGVADLAIGAPGAHGRNGDQPGAVYVLEGPVDGVVSLADVDAKLLGEVDDGWAGPAVAMAGDIDGDGLGDLLTNAMAHEGTSGVEPYIVYGVLGPFLGGRSLADAELEIQSDDGGYLGFFYARAADVDGSGVPDIAVIAELVPHHCHGARLFLDPTLGVHTMDDADVIIGGGGVYGVHPAGDLNHDGMDDLAIAAGGWGPDEEGAVFLWFGRELW